MSEITNSGRYLQSIGVPSQFLAATLDDFPEHLRPSVVHTEDSVGYFITGIPGVGKTHYAVALLQWAYPFRGRALCPGFFSVVGDAIERLKEAGSTKEREHRLHRARRIGIFLLDDLREDNLENDWSRELFYRLLNYRCNEDMPTIITSTLSLVDIAKKDRAIASRLGSLECVELEGKDRRLEHKQ